MDTKAEHSMIEAVFDPNAFEASRHERMAELRKSLAAQMEAPAGSPKHDAGKPRAGLMMADFPRALLAVAEVATFGAKKYSPSGWLKVDGALSRYNDALDRHMLARHIEQLDAESRLPHLAHAAWNALAVLELELRRTQAGNGSQGL